MQQAYIWGCSFGRKTWMVRLCHRLLNPAAERSAMLAPTTVISLFYRDAIKSTRDEVKPDIVAPQPT